jgi:UDP-N-acetylmuramate dehydrogenase
MTLLTGLIKDLYLKRGVLLVKAAFELLKQKLNDTQADILYNEPMNKHTTFRIGGPAAVFAVPDNKFELMNIIKLCKELNCPHMILGRGSNVLFPDGGIEMVVISTKKLDGIAMNDTVISAGAGVFLNRISDFALEHDLTGFEFACGIPGTLGGAVRMNAGAYGYDISDVFHSALVLDENGNTRTMHKDEMGFKYRKSCIEHGFTVLEAEIVLKKGDKEKIREQIKTNMEARNSKQPVEKPSAGSVFKRPPIEGVFAARLIQDCGLKGYRIGGAEVSEKHCGFIVNTGDATAVDVIELIEHIQNIVQTKTGILLETEVIII